MWFPRVTWQMVAWIGRGRTIAWPPRSPDLTPLDFSVWRYVKEKVLVKNLPVNICRQNLKIYCILCVPGENHLEVQ